MKAIFNANMQNIIYSIVLELCFAEVQCNMEMIMKYCLELFSKLVKIHSDLTHIMIITILFIILVLHGQLSVLVHFIHVYYSQLSFMKKVLLCSLILACLLCLFILYSFDFSVCISVILCTCMSYWRIYHSTVCVTQNYVYSEIEVSSLKKNTVSVFFYSFYIDN